jgi:hypothetical protein
MLVLVAIETLACGSLLNAALALLDTPVARFAKRGMLWLAPMLIVGWLASNLIIDALRPLTDVLSSVLHLADSVTQTPTHDWIANTGLERASGTQMGSVLVPVPADELRRFLVSIPIFLAFMGAAPPANRWRNLFIGLLVLICVFALSACCLVFDEITVIVNHQASLAADTTPPPSFTVTQAPYSAPVFFLAGLSVYLTMQFIPLALPVGLWAAMSRGRLTALSFEPGKEEMPPR